MAAEVTQMRDVAVLLVVGACIFYYVVLGVMVIRSDRELDRQQRSYEEMQARRDKDVKGGDESGGEV